MAAAGELDRLTIPQLKVCLEAHGLAKGGKKADLVNRLQTYFAENPN